MEKANVSTQTPIIFRFNTGFPYNENVAMDKTTLFFLKPLLRFIPKPRFESGQILVVNF